MARKPKPSIFHRQVASRWNRAPQRIRTLLKWCGYVSVIGGAIVVMDKAEPIVEPWFVAHRAYAREVAAEKYNLLHQAQLENKQALDYLLIDQERRALGDAKNDLTQNPHSTSAKEKVERLESSIAIRQERLRAK